MGLFNKHKDDENDFILDFNTVPNENLINEESNTPEITPWDEREHNVVRSNAMTIDEILGVSKAEPIEDEKLEKLEVVIPEKEEVQTETKLKFSDDAQIDSAEELVKKIKEDTLNRAFEQEIKNTAEEPKEVIPPVSAAKPVEKRMSPKAQELYDRMMAERAKSQIAKSTNEKPVQVEEEIKPIVDEATSKLDLPIERPTTETGKSEVPTPSPDDIFNTLSLSIGGENPLSLKKNTFSNSLLDKCKNYVTPEIDDTKVDSIDSIIHSAEEGARKRLANFYESTEKSGEGKYDFSRFGDDVKCEPETPETEVPTIDDTRVIEPPATPPVEPIIEITKSIYNTSPDSTRVIDFKRDSDDIPHIKDTAQMEALRHNLKKLAEDSYDKAPIDNKGVKVNFTGIEEDELPENEVPTFKEEADELDDYNTFDDAESVKADLDAKKVSVMGRLIPTAIITIILFIIDYIAKEAIIAALPSLFVWLNALLLIFGVALNFNTIKGIVGVAFGSPDMDTPAALAFSATTLYTIVTMVLTGMTEGPIIAPIGMMALTFNLIGKRMLIRRISRGFSVIANDDEKYGVTFVEDKVCASVMARGSVMGEVLITVGKKARNITNYLKNSYSEDAYEKKLFPLTIFTLIAGAVLALVGFFSGDSLLDALCSFALVTLAACPPSSLLVCNLPFSVASKKLKNYGAMIAGHEAVEAIANANAVAFKFFRGYREGQIANK